MAVLIAAAPAAALAQEAGEDPAETCGVCHEDLVAGFTAANPHALDRPDTPTCTTCHGDGTQHMDEGGDPSLIKVPRGADGASLCVTCHDATAAAFHGPSAHTREGVTCDRCHSIHGSEPAEPALLVKQPDELCVSCHPRQGRLFERPYGHRLGRAGLDCISCHNPHGGSGERSLQIDRTGEMVCVTCHAEKRGPFVFPHVSGVSGDCMSCHEPHGSSNPNALKRTNARQLCLECHSPLENMTLGSQPPASHDLREPRYRNCTVCHVAIHGSNTSPGLMK
jgi:DmsE family decaheme c-type cytochrome